MHDVPQSDLSANIKLAKHLATHGYHPKKYTPGLWKHESKHTSFTLTVDDFFINYTKKEDAYHLLNVLKEPYIISEDWEAKLYCGVTLDWDYTARTCILSMSNYVAMSLKNSNTLHYPVHNMHRTHGLIQLTAKKYSSQKWRIHWNFVQQKR